MRTQWVAHLACPRCQTDLQVECAYSYHPGVHTFPNGDPGYPPDEDFESALRDNCPACHATYTEQETEALNAKAMEQMPDDGPDDSYPEEDR